MKSVNKMQDEYNEKIKKEQEARKNKILTHKKIKSKNNIKNQIQKLLYDPNLSVKDHEDIKNEVVQVKEQHKDFNRNQNIIISDLQDQNEQKEE